LLFFLSTGLFKIIRDILKENAWSLHSIQKTIWHFFTPIKDIWWDKKSSQLVLHLF
jgi:hypothetical protein